MQIVFLGTGDFAVPSLRALHAAGHIIQRVISQPDRPAGRGRTIKPTPVHAVATELDLAHVQTADLNALNPHEVAAGAAIGVIAAFGQKIGPAVLAAFPQSCINIHGSLLPKYRGAAPYQWAIINGEPETGVTIFQLNERWDAGEIWSQHSIPIGPRETADELHDRLAELGAGLIVDTLADFAAGRVTPQPQDTGQATRAPKLSKADAYVDWAQPADRIVHRIHGLWSWPAATCIFAPRNGKPERLLLARATVADHDTSPTDAVQPGAFHADQTVQAGIGRVRLLEVKPAGKGRMDFAAFANGRQVTVGDQLQPVDSA